MIHKGKQISGGAARNVRIKEAGGLESMIDYTAKMAVALAADQFMKPALNNKLRK